MFPNVFRNWPWNCRIEKKLFIKERPRWMFFLWYNFLAKRKVSLKKKMIWKYYCHGEIFLEKHYELLFYENSSLVHIRTLTPVYSLAWWCIWVYFLLVSIYLFLLFSLVSCNSNSYYTINILIHVHHHFL